MEKLNPQIRTYTPTYTYVRFAQRVSVKPLEHALAVVLGYVFKGKNMVFGYFLEYKKMLRSHHA